MVKISFTRCTRSTLRFTCFVCFPIIADNCLHAIGGQWQFKCDHGGSCEFPKQHQQWHLLQHTCPYISGHGTSSPDDRQPRVHLVDGGAKSPTKTWQLRQSEYNAWRENLRDTIIHATRRTLTDISLLQKSIVVSQPIDTVNSSRESLSHEGSEPVSLIKA